MVGKYHIGGCGLVGLFRPCVYHPSRLGVLKYEEKRRRSPPHPMDGRLQAGREVLFPPPSTKHPVDREDGQWLWRLFKPHGAPNPPPSYPADGKKAVLPRLLPRQLPTSLARPLTGFLNPASCDAMATWRKRQAGRQAGLLFARLPWPRKTARREPLGPTRLGREAELIFFQAWQRRPHPT